MIIKFEELEVGDVFVCDGCLFVKAPLYFTASDNINAICIDEKNTSYFADESVVESAVITEVGVPL